jgi:hypothetical protein
LLRALQQNSVELVEMALKEEPEAAEFPFFDHDFEPPLCVAVRLSCSPDIIRLLLNNKAKVEQRDTHSRTPLALLSSMPVRSCASGGPFAHLSSMPMCSCASGAPGLGPEDLSTMRNALEVAILLLDAGADRFVSGVTPGVSESGPSCLDLALAANNEHLVQLYLGDIEQALAMVQSTN